MNPTEPADVHNADLVRSAREHGLSRRLAAANRWSRIAAWADGRARRAVDGLSR
ncbi:hypothetical protein KGA66_04295 [Actinocrinis puniceicyclus]|uniref:Uncharacterized protein n=1 Tax=Actinocrinis puniceicyclus TaxID=977794 RepID=A0A8J7WJ44_9ACTN|nr:hypothetical protein [Actinocrinis puniceicyclus]MBS2962253.1 hypothetical protein [Actinocrinis puniceicyclus]